MSLLLVLVVVYLAVALRMYLTCRTQELMMATGIMLCFGLIIYFLGDPQVMVDKFQLLLCIGFGFAAFLSWIMSVYNNKDTVPDKDIVVGWTTSFWGGVKPWHGYPPTWEFGAWIQGCHTYNLEFKIPTNDKLSEHVLKIRIVVLAKPIDYGPRRFEQHCQHLLRILTNFQTNFQEHSAIRTDQEVLRRLGQTLEVWSHLLNITHSHSRTITDQDCRMF